MLRTCMNRAIRTCWYVGLPALFVGTALHLSLLAWTGAGLGVLSAVLTLIRLVARLTGNEIRSQGRVKRR